MSRLKSLLGCLLVVGMVLAGHIIACAEDVDGYIATGTWSYQTANTWASVGTPDPPEQGTVTVTQSGSNVTVYYGGRTYTGNVSGTEYTVSTSYPEDEGTTTEWFGWKLKTSFSGFGTIVWWWTDGYDDEFGGSSLWVMKQGYENFAILHRDGAVYNSDTNWNYSSYYAGTAWVVDMEFDDSGDHVLLHKDGALWRSSGGWLLTTPPYYPGSNYARALELVANDGYAILHKDGAIYRSTTGATGWVTTTPPRYPGSNYAVDLELK